jgi:hypothetical protein
LSPTGCHRENIESRSPGSYLIESDDRNGRDPEQERPRRYMVDPSHP